MADLDVARDDAGLDGVAIVGIGLRVPGATTPAQFWRNLRDGVESTTFFDEEALRAAGVSEAALADPSWVRAFGRLDGIERFDAAFFELTPREAELLDPQHRLLLECAWEALESAGYAPASEAMAGAGSVGVYAGVGFSGYLVHHLLGRPDLIETVGGWQVTLSNDKDFAATRIAYKLGLTGPAVAVGTACSTSLVAVSMGCQSLLSYQCDMILAGGCSIHLPQDEGYWHHAGGTLSPDGRCRAFDADAQGTLDANGAVVLALKRMEDAVRDGDTVLAVIRGFAVNNDGAHKVGYTAPGVEGQAAVIREAMEMAGVGAADIGYVETHGTGTELGDVVEIAALAEAFRDSGAGARSCGIGSLKSNFGHLDTAAGAAGVVKTLLAMRHGQLPPTLHFRAPNPKLGLERTPFAVVDRLSDWPRRDGAPRLAGVSSFGIGGTNAHVVLEEAPPPQRSPATARRWQVLPLSARTDAALDASVAGLAAWLRSADGTAECVLPDVAFTLQTGRKMFDRRVALVSRDLHDTQALLQTSGARRFTGARSSRPPDPVFLFPGQDAQFVGMARALLETEPLFRAEITQCAKLLRERHDIDFSARLFAGGSQAADAGFATDPVPLFVVEYALARTWMALGVKPRAMLGYSLGEYACATLAGVMRLEDALDLAVAGARLVSRVRPGALLGVSLPEGELRALLAPGLEITMVMAPRQCIVGGPQEAILALERRLAELGVGCLPSQLGVPFHTAHMEPFLEAYREEIAKVRLSPPAIPYVSCVTGDWITDAQATDPEHYLRIGREPIRLSAGLARVLQRPDSLLLEVGPAQTITSLVYLQPGRPADLEVIASQRDPRFHEAEEVEAAFMVAAAKLWTAGVDLRWSALHSAEGPRARVPLPTYPFERSRFWVEAPEAAAQAKAGGVQRACAPGDGPLWSAAQVTMRLPDSSDWFSVPVWHDLAPLAPVASPGAARRWLIAGAPGSIAEPLAARLRAIGAQAEFVAFGPALSPDDSEAWGALLDARIEAGERPEAIVHVVPFGEANDAARLARGFHAVLALGRAIGARWFSESLQLTVVGDGLFDAGDAPPNAAAAAVMGPLKVLPQEYSNLRTRAVQVPAACAGASPVSHSAPAIERLLAELVSGTEPAVALVGGRRRVEVFTPIALPAAEDEERTPSLRPGGLYLLTGGTGRIGITLARRIAQRAPGARLLLTSRSGIDGDARRSAEVAALRSLGAEVRVVQVDVRDADAMSAAIDAAERDFGPLRGVIHAAGVVGTASFATVGESTREFCEAQFAPKLSGTRALEAALGVRELDFCMLCSSLSPILGGLGFAAYAGANAALDAFGAAHNATGAVRWQVVNWEGWSFDEEDALAAAGRPGAAMAELGLAAEEGAEAFERLLRAPWLERVVLSTADLGRRMRQWVTLDSGVAPAPGAGHARPEGIGDYVAPTGELELGLAGLWQGLLGIDGIGSEDSFFALGGNSLLLTQLLAQIRKRFRLELSLASLFERPTIAAMAELIAQARDDREEGEL